ncbi:MAG: ATP-binding cassette domain-containing protein, partial [Asticcacaulis sp.]
GIYGFIGHNGAGKTTSLRIILGLTRADRGKVEIYGEDQSLIHAAGLHRIGSLIDARAVYPHLTGEQNLDLTRALLRAPKRDIERVLDLVDLRSAARKKVGHYSMGMRQRLGIARALLGQPRLLILDEPLNGLDPDGIADMRRLLRDLADSQSMAVLVSSHLLSELERIADHVGLIHQGRLLEQGPLSTILSRVAATVRLETAEPDRAVAFLKAAGYTLLDRDGSVLRLQLTASETAIPELAARLVNSGIPILGLARENASLERHYQDRTRLESAMQPASLPEPTGA